MGKLDGKVALITGAGTGIGRSAANMFAAEGAELVIAARRQGPLDEVVAEITAAGGKITAKTADMEVQEDIEARAGKARSDRHPCEQCRTQLESPQRSLDLP
jgi:NAD(P)-dependent dehydrogenase (short-subunit alcohol dehydrogenase family)